MTDESAQVEVSVSTLSGEKIYGLQIEGDAALLPTLTDALEENFGYPPDAQQLLRGGAAVLDAPSLEPLPKHLDFTLVLLPFDMGGALRSALELGHDAAVRALLSKVAHDGQEWDDFVRGPQGLAIAAERGHEAVCRALLGLASEVEASAQLFEAAARGCTLRTAVWMGHEGVCCLLLDAAPSQEVRSMMLLPHDTEEDDRDAPALYAAAQCGHGAVCSALLAAAPDSEFRSRMLQAADGLEHTALHYAAVQGHEAVCGVILEALPDDEARGQALEVAVRSTALHWAARGGHAGVLRALLRAAPNSGARSKMLLADGEIYPVVGSNILTMAGTALHVAVRSGHEAACGALLDAAADAGDGGEALRRLLLAENGEGDTALSVGVRYGTEELRQLLLAAAPTAELAASMRAAAAERRAAAAAAAARDRDRAAGCRTH